MLEILPKTKKDILRPIYEVIHAPFFFEEANIFPKTLFDLCKNNPNLFQFLPSGAKID